MSTARTVGAGVTAAALGAAVAVLAGRTVVRRMRAAPDPEAGQPLGLLPPEDLGPVRSFDGTELAVRAAGPEGAPTVLFSHGITLDMTTWYYQWTALSDRYRCVLFDHRAHGRSARPASGDYSVDALGRDLRGVLDHAVGEGPVVLVGHSMGGMAILSLAQRFPEEFGGRVIGAVLADTAASDVLREFFGLLGGGVHRGALAVAGRYAEEPARAEWLRRAVHRWGKDAAFVMARMTNFGPEASPSHVDYITNLALGARVEVWTHMLQDILTMDLRGALGAVAVPALVIVGDRDTVTPKTSAKAIRDALPDARAIVITRAGHVTMMERYGVFNDVVSGFLEEVLARERAAG